MTDLNAILEPGMRVTHPEQPEWGIGQLPRGGQGGDRRIAGGISPAFWLNMPANRPKFSTGRARQSGHESFRYG